MTADSDYKRPESVLVLVYTLDGEVLMLNRVRPLGFWQSVTGSLKRGESPRGAAERQLFEETGLRAGGRILDCRHSERFSIIPPWRARYAPGTHYNREHWFRLVLPCRRHIQPDPTEHVAHRWLPFLQAARLASSYTNRQAILRLLPPTRYP